MTNLSRLAFAAIGFSACIGCQLAQAENGRVVERETNVPIPRAYAVALWFGSSPNPAVSSTRCYSFAVAQADSEGNFSLPKAAPDPGEGLVSRERAVRIFAPSFVEVRNRAVDAKVFAMKKIGEDRRKQLGTLSRFVPLTCVAAGRDKELLPLYRAIYREAEMLAAGDKDLEARYVRTIRRNIERIESGAVLK